MPCQASVIQEAALDMSEADVDLIPPIKCATKYAHTCLVRPSLSRFPFLETVERTVKQNRPGEI
jgi:hypothetical protein